MHISRLNEGIEKKLNKEKCFLLLGLSKNFKKKTKKEIELKKNIIWYYYYIWDYSKKVREAGADLGCLAPRISFCPYFLQLWPSSSGPSASGPDPSLATLVHLGCAFLQELNRILSQSQNCV